MNATAKGKTGRLPHAARQSRSVVECASPLALGPQPRLANHPLHPNLPGTSPSEVSHSFLVHSGYQAEPRSKRRRAAAVPDTGARVKPLASAQRRGVRQPSGALAQNQSCNQRPHPEFHRPSSFAISCSALLTGGGLFQSGGGPPHSRTLARGPCAATAATRSGLRQPSGALSPARYASTCVGNGLVLIASLTPQGPPVIFEPVATDKINAMTPALLKWYAASSRDLPWRRTHDPYATWVWEIIFYNTVGRYYSHYNCLTSRRERLTIST